MKEWILDIEADEDGLNELEGDALSETLCSAVLDIIGVLEYVINEDAEAEGNTEKDAEDVVELEIDPV